MHPQSKQHVLRQVFGYETFRPGQEAIVDCLLGGRNVLAVMPTGAGKSLCYQVPALVKGGLAIVVSPLVALMQDQVAALKLAGVAAETINSSQTREDNVAVWRRTAAGEVRLLYLSPERLMTDRMTAALGHLGVSLLAIDEAHCISQWGASFRPEYDMLRTLRHSFPGVPIGAFTATADEITRAEIVAKLFDGDAAQFVSGFDRPNIRLTVAPKANARQQLLRFVSERRGQSGIVYALSRKTAEDLAALLAANGLRAVAYHAGMTAEGRAAAQSDFMTEKGVIVCATIAFGMGIDKPDVRYVFHADLPASIDAYYQEIGRAGRDGAPAEAVMVYGLGDIRMRRRFIDEEGGGEERRRREHRRLDALMAYCEAPACRRRNLLRYFGEESEACGNCDVCLEPTRSRDATDDARTVLATVLATGQRFGAAHLADLLAGKASDKAKQLGHEKLAVFGAGRASGRAHWQSVVRQMVGSGLLTIDVAGFGGLSLAARGKALIDGSERFLYRADAAPRPAARGSKPASESGSPADDGLVQRLKALRAGLARQRGVPAYVIFSDRSLIDMAARRPLTRAAFAEVHGVGEAKLQQFADVFMAEIRAYMTSQSAA